jgi:hypothetical protein
VARPSRHPKRRLDVEDGRTPAGPSYNHPVEQDEWEQSERERRDREIEQARLRASVGYKLDQRLRARGVTPPSGPR